MGVRLTGTLTCATETEADIVRAHLGEHVLLTLAEPGCEGFEVTPAGPLVWQVRERFADRAAFEAHQARTRASTWGRATAGIARDYSVSDD